MRAQLALVAVIPLVGLAAFAILWAGGRRDVVRDAELRRHQLDGVIATTRMYRIVREMSMTTGLVLAAGGLEELGDIARMPRGATLAGDEQLRDAVAEARRLLPALDAATRAELATTVSHVDRLRSGYSVDGTPEGDADARPLFNRATAGELRATMDALRTSVYDMRTRMNPVRGAPDAATLMDLTELAQAYVFESAVAIANILRPRWLSTASMDDAVRERRILERAAALRLAPSDRDRLLHWPQREAWARFRDDAMAGRSPNTLRGINMIYARSGAINALQTRIATEAQARAADEARSAGRAFRLALGVALGLGVITLAIAFVVLRHTTAHLRRLAAQARSIGAGDLDIEPMEVRGSDEFAVLAGAFNEMTGTLSALQSRVDAMADGRDDSHRHVVPGHIGTSLERSVARLAETTEALRMSEQVARLTVDTTVEAIWTTDAAGRIVAANAAACELVGRGVAGQVGLSLADVVAWERLRLDRGAMPAEVTDLVDELHLPAGDRIDALVTVRAVQAPDGSSRAMVFVRDITERRDLEERLAWEATHDMLTGLPNRGGLHQELDEIARRRPGAVTLLFIDLDRFKRINDALGHEYGDELLRQVAVRLRDCVRDDDLLARLGGDEFVLVRSGDGQGTGEIDAVAGDIIAAMEEPFDLRGTAAHISASIGIVVEPVATGAAEMIRRADIAMYSAKQNGRGRIARFDASLHRAVTDRLQLEEELHIAIAGHGLHAVFQPVVAAGDRRLRSIELLARWTDADGVVVPPSTFVPLAEDTGQIIAIGRWALGAAARTAATLTAAVPGFAAPIAVNVSGLHLMDGDVVGDVRAACDAAGVPASAIGIELTETFLVDGDAAEVEDALRELRQMGVQVSIDDFGTGYASLTYLERIPAHIVKIDGSYITPVGADPDRTLLVRLICDLTHALGMQVVAERVETAVQIHALDELGCDMVQGHLIAAPMDEAALVSWVRDAPR